MKKFNIAILLMALILIVSGGTVFMFSKLGKDVSDKEQVYLVLKTVSENTDFWQNAAKGAEVAAIELGVEVKVIGPDQESNVEQQIELIRGIIKEKPEAIAIAATDFDALGPVCEEVMAANIALVTFDSDANMTTEHSFVATNNLSAAQRIGHELATLLSGQGIVGIIAHAQGAYTTTERIDGFERGINPYDDIELIPLVYYNDSHEEAYESTKDIIATYPEINALYATNEVTLLGMANAIRDMGMEEDIIVVGFDMNNDIALLIEQDIIDVTMVQKPFNMGYMAVKEVLEVMGGKKPDVIDTGAVMINKENMFLPENQKFVVPNVN